MCFMSHASGQSGDKGAVVFTSLVLELFGLRTKAQKSFIDFAETATNTILRQAKYWLS